MLESVAESNWRLSRKVAVVQVTSDPRMTNERTRASVFTDGDWAAGSGRRKKYRMTMADEAVAMRPPVRP